MQTETASTTSSVPLVDTEADLFDLQLGEFVPALIADYAGYSDTDLEKDFVMYKQAAESLCARGIRGEANLGDIERVEKIIAAARCILTVAYPRGLQWALDEKHRTRPMATA